MTKLTLVLALVAAYGVGFWKGSKPQAMAAPSRGPREKQAETKRAAVPETPAAPRVSAAEKFSEALTAVSPIVKDEENNVTFAKLVQQCANLETDWSARNVEQKAKKLYQLADYENLRVGFAAQMSAMASHSLNWFGEGTFAIDGDPLTVHTYVMFHLKTETELADPCWRMETRILRAGEWKTAGYTGGCPASLSVSPENKPLFEQTLYYQPAMGSLISTMLFPMDAQSGDTLEILPAVSGQWMNVPFKFSPISEAQLAEDLRMDAEVETRSPASEGN